MATTDTADKQRLIKKRKMDEIICVLETADRSELLEKVIEDVGSGYHVTHFRDRQQRCRPTTNSNKQSLDVAGDDSNYRHNVQGLLVGICASFIPTIYR